MREGNNHLEGSVIQYVRQNGTCLIQRTRDYDTWERGRRNHSVCPYQRVCVSSVGKHIILDGDSHPSLNFSSQDYLGLSQDVRLVEAAHHGAREFGVHSAGSPAFCGATKALRNLEARIAKVVGGPEAVVYPTGWAAGYGVLAGLIRKEDFLFMDALSHNCLQEGARSCGGEVIKFKHNDLLHLEELLAAARSESAGRGIFVVAESLYSMDSDSPDLEAFLVLCERYKAISVLDVAHDFGSMGNHGRGLLDTVPGRLPDVVLGSFSKTFAATGGFAVAQPEVINYLRYYSPTNLFSNAISPMQTYVANKAFEIAFSVEGRNLRSQLAERVRQLRGAMVTRGLEVHGTPSPICPVFVGNEALARLTSKYVAELGMAANLVEFPAVARGKARFRFQVMASHSREDVERAAEVMEEAKCRAEEELKNR